MYHMHQLQNTNHRNKDFHEGTSNMASLFSSSTLHTFSVPLPFLDNNEGRRLFAADLQASRHVPLKLIDGRFLYVVQSPSPSPTTTAAPVSNNAEGDQFDIPFWLILQYQQARSNSAVLDCVRVYFYWDVDTNLADSSGNATRETVMRRIFGRVRRGISKVVKHINQVLLLHQLHESKMCSPLLVPPEQSDLMDDHANRQHQQQQQQQHRLLGFKWGGLSCRCVHVMKLALHSRIPVNKAVAALVSTALHPFAVANRKNLFVYREKTGKVFYLKLLDSSVSSTGATPTKKPLTPAIMPRSSSKPNIHALSTSNVNLAGAAGAGSSSSGTVTIEVFGTESPSNEITEQLYQLLESKLASITLSHISTLLERNPLLKLTLEDIEFIRGPRSSPTKTLAFTLPSQFIQHANPAWSPQLLVCVCALFLYVTQYPVCIDCFRRASFLAI
jgi:hypothetical protein